MWPHVVTAAPGMWLMAAPSVLGYGPAAWTNEQIVGPLVVALAVIAVWEATLSVRWGNVVLGLWLLVTAWVQCNDDTTGLTLQCFAVGAPLALLATIRGPISQQVGGWSAMWTSDDGAPK